MKNILTALGVALALALGLLAGGVVTSFASNPHKCTPGHPEYCQTTTTTSTTTTTTTTPTPGYLFDDEFSGTGAPDSTKWWATPWCSTSADDQEGCYNAANAFQDGQGHLVLRISNGTGGRPYDFARVQTFQEGSWPPPAVKWSSGPPIRIEARIKFAPGAGLWGAFWHNSPTSPSTGNLELDVQEFRGALPTIDDCHVHWWTGSWSDQVLLASAIDTGVDLSADFHTYWVDYRAGSATFGIDSLTCGSASLPQSPPEMIRLDNIVGVPGTWGGLNGPPDPSLIPADMLVDYVRVTSL